jgi:hypothetical protein
MDPAHRVQSLIALVLDPAASEGERRNAAAVARRLIAEHGLLLFTAQELEAHNAKIISADKRPPQKIYPWTPVPAKPKKEIRAQADGLCLACKTEYFEGDIVNWRFKEGIIHKHCNWDDYTNNVVSNMNENYWAHEPPKPPHDAGSHEENYWAAWEKNKATKAAEQAATNPKKRRR